MLQNVATAFYLLWPTSFVAGGFFRGPSVDTSMILNIETAPATLLITLEDAKQNLAIEHSLDDARITNLIKAAQELIEEEADVSLQSTTYTLKSCNFPSTLLKPPVASIDSIEYFDADNAQQTLASSEYYLLSSRYEAKIIYPNTLPSIYSRPDAVTTTYTTGYSVIPERAKQACRQLVELMNEHRGDGEFQIPTAVKRLIKSLKHGGFN